MQLCDDLGSLLQIKMQGNTRVAPCASSNACAAPVLDATTRQAELDQGLSRALVMGLETISNSGHNADARNKFGVSLLLATLGWLRVVLGVLNLQMREFHLEIKPALRNELDYAINPNAKRTGQCPGRR